MAGWNGVLFTAEEQEDARCHDWRRRREICGDMRSEWVAVARKKGVTGSEVVVEAVEVVEVIVVVAWHSSWGEEEMSSTDSDAVEEPLCPGS